MASKMYDRILDRELGYTGVRNNRYSKVRGIYGDQKWIEDLDIVNELSGHSGCVNALSWSRSGRLLASGSDDQHINLHTYLPDSSTKQFQFTTTIATGHRANIFSVKFMPNANDRTIVSAAGDREVRVFDIEYAGRAATTGLATEHRSARDQTTFRGVRYLSEGDTNAKVFRSHGDRVKRIVTESSPYFFMTCSEDGEVRQWDTRQPSSAYPAPRDRPISRRLSAASEDVPPPLISYKRYNLDLNTISCSASQPHYIALGGAHLHCFLHDRRMLGRDKLLERGLPPSSPTSSSNRDEELRDQATYCVKKFAPNGKQTMRRHDSGHITACKISDANPNELIVSWSGDWIYNFDINRAPDARHNTVQYTSVDNGNSTRLKESAPRKRKRTKVGLTSTDEEARASSRARTQSVGPGEDEEMALMVQYENGQSEEIPIESRRSRMQAANKVLSEAEKLSCRIAKATVKLRKHMFSLAASRSITTADPTGHATSFTSVLGLCGSILPDMDDVMQSWRYPVDPTGLEIEFQNRLRASRGSARRLVQASGTLARALGGRLRMSGGSEAMIAKYFSIVSPAPNERKAIPKCEHFGYEFLKAILLWLDSGIGALIEGFSPSETLLQSSPRCPIPPDATSDAVDEYLIPYLLRLASTDPVINVDASWLESDENRVTFVSEKAAVISFAQALKIPFADLSNALVSVAPEGATSSSDRVQDRKTALKFWAFKVGRGVLMGAAKGVDFELVDHAFGGLGCGDAGIAEDESALAEKYRLRAEGDGDPVVQHATLVRRDGPTRSGSPPTNYGQAESSSSGEIRSIAATVEDEEEDSDANERALPLQELQNAARDLLAENSNDDEDDSNASSDDDHDDDDDDGDRDDDEDEFNQRIFWRSGYTRGLSKEKVESKVPCGTHTRIFKGHCNVKTVKDVNFYGLEDEYVVSGSDSGHLFIWDRKTSKLLNILEGDGEVVNVVQGHPYEPILAVSGIDHTVKIFSPDARSRADARNGIGVSAADASDFSSIRTRMRRRQAPLQPTTAQPTTQTSSPENDDDRDSDDEVNVALNGLKSRKRIQDEYQITSENDNQRRGGNADAFVTQSMLMQIAAHLRERQAAGHDNDLPLVLPGGGQDGDCLIM